MAKYITKPVEIEAIEWTGENLDEIKEFMDWLRGLDFNYLAKKPSMNCDIQNVKIGDFIIKGAESKFYVCKADDFHRKYYTKRTMSKDELQYCIAHTTGMIKAYSDDIDIMKNLFEHLRFLLSIQVKGKEI